IQIRSTNVPGLSVFIPVHPFEKPCENHHPTRMGRCQGVGSSKPVKRAGKRTLQAEERDDRAEFRGCERAARTSLRTDEGACQSNRAMPPDCRLPKHQENGLAPLEEEQWAPRRVLYQWSPSVLLYFLPISIQTQRFFLWVCQ